MEKVFSGVVAVPMLAMPPVAHARIIKSGAKANAAGGAEASSVDYVRLHPTDPAVIDTNDRAYFVNLADRTAVYSPGAAVAIEAN